MNTRTIHVIIGILYALTGCITLLDGICHMRASNLFIGIGFVTVGCLYLKRKKKMQ